MERTQLNNPFSLSWLMQRYGHHNPLGVVYINWKDEGGRFMILATDG